MGSPRAAYRACFHTRTSQCLTHRSAKHKCLASSPLVVPLLQSSNISGPARWLSPLSSTYPGSTPSSRHPGSRLLIPRGPTASVRSVLRLSLPFDGLLRLRVREFVSPLSRVHGLSPFRGFSLRAATLPHRKKPAPMPLRLEHCYHALRLGLRGIYPHEVALFPARD